MRKYSLLLLAVALLYALTMVAQTSGSSSSSSGQMGQSGSSSSPQTGTSSMGSQSSSSGMGAQSGSQASGSMSDQGNKGKEKTVEGCIARQQNDFVVYTKKGKAMRVSGQDLSAHVGHLVKLHGTEQNASGMGSTSGTTGGTSGATASGAMPQSSEPSTSGQSGNIGSSTAGSQSGMSSSSSASSNLSNKELVVDRVEHVADTCPSNIQEKINSSGTGNKSNPSSPY